MESSFSRELATTGSSAHSALAGNTQRAVRANTCSIAGEARTYPTASRMAFVKGSGSIRGGVRGSRSSATTKTK
jgi:hypothetical protein